MKLLLEGSISEVKFENTGTDTEYSWNYEQVMKTKLGPYGENLIKEKSFCDKVSKEYLRNNWDIRLGVLLSFLKDEEERVTYVVKVMINNRGNKQETPALWKLGRKHPGATISVAVNFQSVDQPTRQILLIPENGVRHFNDIYFVKSGVSKEDVLWLTKAAKTYTLNQYTTITINVPEPVRNPVKLSDPLKGYKRILDEGFGSDTVIKLDNEVTIKCHKSFLIARSDVFRAMFENDMKESRTGTIHISDMTDRGMKAFLRYLYYGGVTDAEENAEIAVELLYASDKYNVVGMEQQMVELLNEKNLEAFSVELALKIFLFVSDKEYLEAKILRATQVGILKKRFYELKASTCMNNLHKEQLIDLLCAFRE